MENATELDAIWPSLPYEGWAETCETLHMWTQIVGKVRLALSPPENQWWGVALYVTTRGLTTSPMPYEERTVQIDFDFIDQVLIVSTSTGEVRAMALAPKTVASFYREFMGILGSLKIDVQINQVPSEVPDPIPFGQDTKHAAYDREGAFRFWQVLVQVDRLMKIFRCEFMGKCSPVHFFWGSFDMAVTRFSGRKAPPRPGADAITHEGYSHEVSSCGFWPGSQLFKHAAFYSYMAPEPNGFQNAAVHPDTAFYNQGTNGFILLYEDVRKAADPDAMVLDFFQSTYDAGADLARWDRVALERNFGQLKDIKAG